MRTKIISFSLLLFLISSPTKAQGWEFIGLDSMVIYNLNVKGDTIWAGTRDLSVNNKSGLYRSVDGGLTWRQIDSSLGTGSIIYFDIVEDNAYEIYMIKNDGQYEFGGTLFKTTNGGTTWIAINQPEGIIAFNRSPLNNDEYYVVNRIMGHKFNLFELFIKSTDAGGDWEYKCCPGIDMVSMDMNFTIDKLNSNILYISGVNLGYFFRKSTDRGESWENLSGPQYSQVFSDYFLANRIYLFGYQFKSISNDGGHTWENITGGLPMDGIFISFYQDNNSSLIFTLMKEGLFYSDNDEFNWKLIEGSDNLPLSGFSFSSSKINNLSIDHLNNLLYIGTFNGVYKSNFITDIKEEDPPSTIYSYTLEQNYPNPFNPTTKISYQIPENSFITIKVYNVLGGELATLVQDEKLSGKYEVEFDAAKLPSGIYFYRLQAGAFVETKKMVLVR